MIKYIKKYKKTLLIVLPLFFISYLSYLSVYRTELVVSVVFKIVTRGNIKIEKLAFEEGSNYKKGTINLNNVDLYDSYNIKAGEIPKVEIEYNDLKIKNINIYKPNIIFIRKKNYYNIADIFVKIASSKKIEKKEKIESKLEPILGKINVTDASVVYIDKSYSEKIEMKAENVNSTIDFFKGYSIDIKASGNKGNQKYILNFNTLSGKYDFNIIGKNIKMNETILQYAYDSDGEINNIDGNLDIDFRMNEAGYFGSGKINHGKARYNDISLPISNINLDLKFLGKKIDIEGNYLVGEKDKGFFNLEYSVNNGTNIDFKFKDLSYKNAASYKYLNDLNLDLDEVNFNKVDVNLKYKEKLKVNIFFNSEKGLDRSKFSISDIYGDFIYENKELILKDVNSKVIINSPKKKISGEILTNLKYKDNLGKVDFILKDQGTIFSDIEIGLSFKLAKDKNIFIIESKLFNLNGEYNFKSRMLNITQKNNFKLKFNLETKKILNLKGFLIANLEEKQIVLNMKKESNEIINIDGEIIFKF